MTEFSGLLTERLGVEQWAGDPEAGVWTSDGNVWGGLVPVDGGPDVLGEGRVSRTRYRLTLRARTGIGLATRFLWRGRKLSVLRLEPDHRLADRTTVLVEDRG
ncbi:hypothetical protein [Glacieibacterium sp.]|uniref:hypothetical protein n=1 Tax=Glacieibacterium sp. TaxID=2860237 RepID=UPI003B00D692